MRGDLRAAERHEAPGPGQSRFEPRSRREGPPRLSVADAQGRPHRLFLSHYAHRAWPGLWRETRHLYGHSHGCLADTTRSCDVGVDAWNDRPVTLDAILIRQDAASGVPEELAAHGLR